jgi:hypothetical protein
MSIEIEFINLIIPKEILEEKYEGGIGKFKTDCPNKSFREDESLVRVGFMNNNDLYTFLDLVTSNGLEYKEGSTTDFVIINTLSGVSWDVDWVEHNFCSCWFVIDNK